MHHASSVMKNRNVTATRILGWTVSLAIQCPEDILIKSCVCTSNSFRVLQTHTLKVDHGIILKDN